MARADDLLKAALQSLDPKPDETAPQAQKKSYSEKISNAVAPAFAAELRERGLLGARPAPPGVLGGSGAERRMAGAIGAKKVDVTWATEESGLLLGISIKSINWRDAKTGNFQKNLTNRRGDMLIEAVTLHRRFPYAALGGFMFLDKDAAMDNTATRRSTFLNAHNRLRLFDGRDDPAGREEQYERLYLGLLDANPFAPEFEFFRVGDPATSISLEAVFDDLVGIVAERNPDFYEAVDGVLRKAQ
jgi:hypothetical protein